MGQSVVEAVGGINKLVPIQRLLQLLKLVEEWLEHLLKSRTKSSHVHLRTRDLPVVIRVELVEEQVDLGLLGLLHDLLAILVRFGDVFAHALNLVFFIPPGLLLFLQNQSVALVEVHGYSVCAGWPVSENERLVCLGLEHFCAGDWIDNAIFLHFLLLPLQIMVNFSLFGQSLENFALGAASILEGVLLLRGRIPTREVSHSGIGNKLLRWDTSDSWLLSLVFIFL